MKGYKKFLVQIVGYTVLALVLFGATFSTGDKAGMDIVIQGHEWMNFTANIISNFVVVINILYLLVGVITLMMAFLIDQHIENTVKQLVEWWGVVKTGEHLRFKLWALLLISVPTWVWLVASGWIFTAFCFMWLHVVMQLIHAMQRGHFKEKYIIEPVDEEKEDDLSHSPL